MLLPIQPRINYFGDGSDGNLNTSDNINFNSAIDGPTVYKNFVNLSINSGHTVTVENRCKGLVIYCLGDCIINGVLQMTARGASAVGENFAPNGFNKLVQLNASLLDFTIPASGASGVPSNNHGIVGINGQTGGGAGGYVETYQGGSGGYGSAGTSFSGGSGGGGTTRVAAGNGEANGGAGGYGGHWRTYSCAGGAGNPGGWGDAYGASGTGGLIILVVKGSLNIGLTGVIRSNGSDTGNAYACGGGSGGGSITILYSKSFTNLGTVQANGGSGSWWTGSNHPGFNGGAGSIRMQQMREF